MRLGPSRTPCPLKLYLGHSQVVITVPLPVFQFPKFFNDHALNDNQITLIVFLQSGVGHTAAVVIDSSIMTNFATSSKSVYLVLINLNKYLNVLNSKFKKIASFQKLLKFTLEKAGFISC